MRILIYFACIIFVVNGNTIDEKDILYPPYWHLAPSSIYDFPLISDSLSSYRLIDPWDYLHRLGLYKILINISSPFMPFCSKSNASNILFALPSQFGWLFSSNRLFTNGTMNISIDSWWASANYYLSVLPFLVAVDLDLLPKNESFRIVRYENFCSTSRECFHQIPKAMAQWNLFFLHLQQSSICLGNRGINQHMIDRCYLGHVWSAYKKTIAHALPLVQSKLDKLPSDTEKFFGLGWARLINLISMTRKNTNLYYTIQNQRKFLPFRMLNQSDRAANSNDLPDLVNQSLKILFTFRFDQLTLIENIWQRITCNYHSRVYAQHTLDSMAISKFLALRYFAQALFNAFIYECDR